MKFLGNINNQKDVVVKEITDSLDTRLSVMENKANSIFSSVNETFATNERIDSALTTATWENGYVRALYANKYQEFFDNIDMLEQPLGSFIIENSSIKRTTTQTNSAVSFTTKTLPNFTGGVTQATVSFPELPTLTTRSGFKSSEIIENVTHNLASKYVDVDGNEWTIRHDNALTATGGTYLSAKQPNGNSLFTEIRLHPASGNNALNVGATTRNLCIVGDNENIYVAYYTTLNDIALRIIRRSDRILGTALVINTTATNGYRGQDLLIHNGRLFHIRTTAPASETRFSLRSHVISGLTISTLRTTTDYSDATIATSHYCKLALDSSSDTVLAVGFRRASSSAVHYKRLNATTGVETSSSWTTVSASCYGNGAVKFHDGSFRIVYEQNNQTSFGYFTVNPSNGASSSVQSQQIYDGLVTISPFRFDIVCFDGKLIIFHCDMNYDILYASYFVLSSSFSTLSSAVVYVSTPGFRGVDVYGVTATSYEIMVEDHTNSAITVVEYGSVTETLNVSIRNASNDSQLGSSANYVAGNNSMTFNIPQTNNFRIRFITSFALRSVAGLSDSTSSFELKGFDVEATASNPPSTSTESWFYSDVLIDNQYVDSVMLTPVVENASNGSFEWSVSASGSNWQNITNFGQFINLTTTGVFLKVRCKITRNQGVNTLSLLPRIQGFEVTTKSVVTTSDLYPLQINLMKMGLQVGMWNASNRTGFKNMMIDLFNDSNGVFSSTVTYDATNKLYSGSGTVTSVAENTDNNIFPAQIIVVDDFASSSGIVYQVKRNNGNWETVTANAVHTFQSGVIQLTNQVQIQATLSSHTLTGWAYLYA